MKTGHYFSDNRHRELLLRWLGWGLTALLGIALLLFWEPLRSNDFILRLYSYTKYASVEYIFRALTFFGDDEGHIIFIMVFYWCVNKTLGFRTMMMLLSSAIYIHFLKEGFDLPRPDMPGMTDQLDSKAFPSGHTLSVMAVWGYLAVKLQKKAFWVCAFVVIALVGLSRMVLGFHFAGDIVGGFFFGFIYLALVFGISSLAQSKGWQLHLSFPLLFGGLLVFFTTIAGIVVAFMPGEDPLKVVGFLAGTILGYVIEREKVRFNQEGSYLQHALKLLVGAAVMFIIVFLLKEVLPQGAVWGFVRYTLAGFWATCLAPYLFVLTGLSARETVPKIPGDRTAVPK